MEKDLVMYKGKMMTKAEVERLQEKVMYRGVLIPRESVEEFERTAEKIKERYEKYNEYLIERGIRKREEPDKAELEAPVEEDHAEVSRNVKNVPLKYKY